MIENVPGITLHGILGEALRRSAEQRLKKVDYDQLVEPFRLRNEDDGAWRCEFWGKIVRSAILTNYYLRDPELSAIIDRTVKALMATQTADGCVSTYPADKQPQGWDIWGRKYALLGLLRYYDLVSPDPQVKTCCAGIVDHLMTQVGPGKLDITACGRHLGLAASSILGAVVGVYRITREPRFLDYAHWIVSRGCSSDGDIFAAARAGTPPVKIGTAKAYEMTSCFQGLSELWEFDPKPEYRQAVERYCELVRDRELFVTGGAGLGDRWGEYWGEGASRQPCPGPREGLGETCVTVTWLRYCSRLMRSDSSIKGIADEVEKTCYNALLGALAPDGTHWAHVNPTPLTGGGFRSWANDQIELGFHTPFGGNDCCRAQGPEGLALAPWFALRRTGNVETLNFYEPMTAPRFIVEGNYPVGDAAEVRITEGGEYVLKLRIPEFTKSVKLNGETRAFTPGSYLELRRDWRPNDRMTLDFDFSVREVPVRCPCGTKFVAYKRGPLVLAADSRGAAVPDARVKVRHAGRDFVDYASAGNTFSPDNTLTVLFKK